MTLTPKQFSILATKNDLRDLEERLDKKIDKKIDKVLTAVDGIAKNFQKFDQELVANQGAHDRFEETFAKTDKRIKIMEYKIKARHDVA